MPPMPAGVEEGILKGLYRFKAGAEGKKLKAHIFGSGPIINQALRAQQILAERYGVSADVWSATNYKELRNDALLCQRWNMLHPTQPRAEILRGKIAREREGRIRGRFGLHAHRARTKSPHGFPAASSRSAPTALAAATPARTCAASSKWTPNQP